LEQLLLLLLVQVVRLAVLLAATAAAGARTWRSQMQHKLALQRLQAKHCRWPAVGLALKVLQPQYATPQALMLKDCSSLTHSSCLTNWWLVL
jgi:hypothetical protein